MSASQLDINLIRMRIGDSAGDVFTEPELQALWTEAAETYTETADLRVATIVAAIEVLQADAAKRVTYKMNESSESESDIFKHLTALKKQWEAKLTAQRRSRLGSVRVGRAAPKPSRLKEWPDE